jgi:UDP-N-acetylglucosamine--N-acetylmuramyl-(pentapeptide) pyrophosphoryl-undecaprenol N-acetylglucosamine transferase
MASAYHRAHLVVSRAGATTLFELAALGKPSILIPYPFAANQHQETNARALALLGGAEVIDQKDLTGERLGQALVRYMDDPSALKEMGERARRMARPDAAKTIVDHLLEMAR